MSFPKKKTNKLLESKNSKVSRTNSKKKSLKESVDGTISDIYVVLNPSRGTELQNMVHTINPIQGAIGSGVDPDQVHSMYSDDKMAGNVAQKLYNEFQMREQAIEEKKVVVVEKIKKAINKLERVRKAHVGMIQENPMAAEESRHKIAELQTKIDQLMEKMSAVESSKRVLGEKENLKESRNSKNKK